MENATNQIGLSVAMGNVNHIGQDLKHMFVTINAWMLKFLAEENVFEALIMSIVMVFVNSLMK